MANGSTSSKTTLSEKSSSLSSDTLRRIPSSEIHIRYYDERDGDTILWSGYGVVWTRRQDFIRLSPYFPTYQEASETERDRRFESNPSLRPTATNYALVKKNGRMSSRCAVAQPLRRVPKKNVGFAHRDHRHRASFKGYDLREQRFGLLLAKQQSGQMHSGHFLWTCECDCGNTVVVRTTMLTRGHKTSCGCDRPKTATPAKTSTGVIQEDTMQRRDLLIGLLAAPAIVRASSLMRVRTFVPDWIRAHRNNPLFGELIVRRPGVEKLSQFADLIRPGEFLWKAPDGKLIDLCMFDHGTFVEITSRFLTVRNPAYLAGTGYALRADPENVQAGNLIANGIRFV